MYTDERFRSVGVTDDWSLSKIRASMLAEIRQPASLHFYKFPFIWSGSV
jgi:hypothetical protein